MGRTKQKRGLRSLGSSSMTSGRSFASLELAYENDEGNHGEGQPADHPEAIHEGEEHTLVQELLIDNSERSRPSIGASESILHQVAHHILSILL